MSYSFSVSGANKDEAKDAAAKQFDTIVEQQEVHSLDRDAAQGAVEAFIDIAGDPTGSQRVNVSCYGSITTYQNPSDEDPDAPRTVTGSSINISVTVV